MREAILDVDPDDAHKALSAYRRKASKIKVEPIKLREVRPRCAISPAKFEFLHAVQAVIEKLKDIWPLTLRQIHYQLLNDPPLIHSKKPGSRYRNNLKSSKALSDLVTRARIEGMIDQEKIHDPTRPLTVWIVHANLAAYYARQMAEILNGYWRDLMQSQPNHIEIVVEKNTLQGILNPVAMEFCIPISSGRGQNTTRPIYDIAQRYRKSGKAKLIILAVSDLDPDGDAIAHSIGQRLRDDHHIQDVEAIKVALTMEQVERLSLPKSAFERAKKSSPNYKRYVDRYETDFVWELEAVPYEELRKLLTQHIEAVIDREAYNYEVSQEKADAAHNEAVRKLVLRTLVEQIREQNSN